MKKLGLLLCLALLLALCLTSCDTHTMGDEIGDARRYATKTVMETSQLQFEYEKDGATVGVYYLGRVTGVPFAPSATVEHKLGGFDNMTYTASDFDEAALPPQRAVPSRR